MRFTADLTLPLLYDVVYDVDETGAKIITPKTVPKPEPSSLPFLNQGSFLGYYGKFHTTDSGEEEVELKVYDENGNTVGFLPGVVLPPAPDEFYAKWAPTEEPKPPKEDTWDGTEPILYFIESFMPGNSNEKIADYTDRISKDSENYEAYIGRGFTWLTSLSESNATLLVMEKFGFGFDDRNGKISRIPALSNFDFGEKLQNEPKIDEACAIAIPALKNAIADFAMVPEDWAGAVDFTYQPDMKHPADVTVSFGYADTLLARALCCEMISALYLMKGYNTVCADRTTKKDIDLGALKEAQRWMRSAAEMVNAFVPAEANRPDPSRNYFFNLILPADEFLRQNAQNLLDVPYWTVRFDFSLLPELLFLNGEETALKKEKRIALLDYNKFDMTLRNVFEGKLSREAGTFPVLKLGFQNLDESVTDPTFAGTFPGMSRTALAGFLWPLEEDKVLKTLPNNPNEEIAHYGALYWIPEGAENNPDNPATFSSGLEHKIRLKNPTLEGYDFLGWTHNGVIPASEIPVGAAESLEFSARFAKITPEGEEKQGTSDNPWEIGQSNTADVKAWMGDAGTLTIAGEGKMKDFTLIEAPWYWVRDSITALEIGSGVTTLGELAFNNCRGLTSVTIPSSVGTIGERAFYGCPLSRVIAMNERPSWPLDEAFGPPSQFKGVVLVPAPVVDKYKAAFGWDKYADFIRGMALVTLPPTVGYVVRDLSSEGAEIAPTEVGGTTYALPIGARVSIDVVEPEEQGYVVVGDSYVIDSVEWGMAIDESLLPRVVSEALYQTGTGSDGETYTSEVENGSEGDVENPVKVCAIEGLIDIATSLNTNVTLKVAAKDAASVDPDVAAAVSNELEKVSAGGFDSVAFVDLSIFFDKEAQENCELGTVIKLHIPWQVKSGDTYGVVRMHNDKAQVIPQGEANKTSDGEYFEVDFEKGELVLCIGKFSDYAIAEETPPLKVGENAYMQVEDGNCTIFGEGLVTGFPSDFDCGSISNVVVESGIMEIGEGFFYPCLSLKSLRIEELAAAHGLEKAVVYWTAINPDGTLYPIPSISIPGYQEVLCGATDPTGKDGWQPVPSDTRMEESGYHFFKYVLKRE